MLGRCLILLMTSGSSSLKQIGIKEPLDPRSWKPSKYRTSSGPGYNIFILQEPAVFMKEPTKQSWFFKRLFDRL